MTGPHRAFTQACARYIHELVDAAGQPRFAGIHYPSRLNRAWGCWAVFDDRMRGTPGMPTSFFPDDPELMAVAKLFDLTIEVFEGRYLRPN